MTSDVLILTKALLGYGAQQFQHLDKSITELPAIAGHIKIFHIKLAQERSLWKLIAPHRLQKAGGVRDQMANLRQHLGQPNVENARETLK